MSGVRVSWIKAITCSYCIAFSLMDLPLGHRPFPASVTSQMGKAKPTLPGEIETNTRYANIIYLVYKWQSWSVLASEKSREKPKGRKVIKETLCWFPRSSLSSWRSWDSSNMTWDLGYLVSMPTVLSSHFPISMAFLTVWDSFLRTIFEEKMLQSFSYSSSRLGSKQHLQSSSCNPHSLQLLHECVCTFVPWCNSQKLQLGGTSSGQIPSVLSDTHGVTGSWCFPCSPHALGKGSRPGHAASWLGFCLGKVVVTMGTLGLCLMWQAGRNLHWSQGAVSFGPMKAALFPSRSCCLSSPWLEVAPCVWWWRELCAVRIPWKSCPQLHMGCGEKTILPACKNIKLHLASAEEGPLCSKLANHPVQISLNFS